MGYAFTTIVNDHGDLTTVSNLLLLPRLWSPAGHMAWTGVTAAALYYAAEQRFSQRTTGVLVAVFALAVGLHTAWDTIQAPWAYAAIAIVGLGSLAAVVHRQLPTRSGRGHSRMADGGRAGCHEPTTAYPVEEPSAIEVTPDNPGILIGTDESRL